VDFVHRSDASVLALGLADFLSITIFLDGRRGAERRWV